MESFEGKVAVITGAGSGIGAALARRAASEGMRLMLADIDAASLGTVSSSIRAGGAEVQTRVVDVADQAEIDALAAASVEAFGSVHLVCNNAGIGSGGGFTDVPIDEWKHVIDVDLWSVIYGIHAFLPILRAQDEGHVVNTASLAGLIAPAFLGPYAVAKYGVVAASETLAAELAMFGSNVGVSVLCPGWVRTGISSVARARLGAEVSLGEGGPPLVDVLDGFIDSGIDADDVASVVFDGVRANRFYLLTHPDSAAAFTARARAAEAGEIPPVAF